MASLLKVDKLDPQSGTALEIGTSGDTITVPSGASLTLTDSTLSLPTTITSTTEVKTNKISPASGVAFTLGDSGDTFTVPSGATIVNSGTATGFGGGLVLQVIRASTTTITATTSTSMVDITNLTVNITPASTSNKVFVIMNVNGINAEASDISGVSLRIYQASDVSGEVMNIGYGTTAQLNDSATLTALDSPSSTSELTYKGQCRNRVVANIQCNSSSDTSSITVMEIEG